MTFFPLLRSATWPGVVRWAAITALSLTGATLACGSDATDPPQVDEGDACLMPECSACGTCLSQCLCLGGTGDECVSACGLSGGQGGSGGTGPGSGGTGPGSGGTGPGGSGGQGGGAGGSGGQGGSGGSGPGGGGPGGGGPGGSGPGGSGPGGSGPGGSGGSAGVGGGGGSGGTMPPPPPPPPGDVTWLDYPEQHQDSDASWGWALADIAKHLPKSYGSTYWDSDLVTAGHETSHGIHAHLRNNFNNTGQTANAFYVLNDRAALVVEPNIRKSDVNPYVPQSLRDSRYGTYLQGASSWDDRPLYLWDEWVAYTNGTEVGVAMVDENKWTYGWRDQFGNLEFTVYGLAVGMAVEALDASYWNSNDQFRAFMKWQTERAMDLFQRSRTMTAFEWDKVDDYYAKMQTSADAEDLRKFARRAYGDAWAQQVMGF